MELFSPNQFTEQHKNKVMYTDEEKLDLQDQVNITRYCKDLLKQERERLRRQGRKVSIAKLACNIILEALEHKQDEK